MNKRFSKTFVMCIAILASNFYIGATAFASDDVIFNLNTVVESDNFTAGMILYDTLSIAVENTYNTTILSEYSVNNTVETASSSYSTGSEAEIPEEGVPVDDVPEGEVPAESDSLDGLDAGGTMDFANIGIAETSTNINIRQQPNVNSNIVGKLFNGAFVTITEHGEWCKITSGGVTGYVKSELLAIGQEAESVYNKYVDVYAIVSTKLLNVRSEQSMDSETIAQIKSGEQYSVVEKGDEWVKISIDGKNGYVLSQYISTNIEYSEAISIDDEEALSKAEAKVAALNAVTETVSTITHGSVTTLSDADYRLFVCVVFAESGGEPYEGKLGVANVILNRLHSGKYPNTMEGVIYQKGQFGPVKNGALNKQLGIWDSGGFTKPAHLETIKAVDDALNGINNIGTRLYFNGYKVEVNKGHKGTLKIGNHLFWEQM